MEYNARTGKKIMNKYLGNEPRFAKRLEHSISVGDLASKVANRISQRNPELNFDVEICGFLGYSHDIGYSVKDEKHELHTIDLLIKEGIPKDIARKAMHGQLAEQFGEKEGDIKKYLPIGLEGMILTYCDMSVRIGEPVSIRERAKEIIERVRAIPYMPEQLKKDIEDNMHKALPRYERYEQIILASAGVKSASEL